MALTGAITLLLFFGQMWNGFAQQASPICPLSFSLPNRYKFIKAGTGVREFCQAVKEELNLVVAEYVQKNQIFLFPNATAVACMQGFERLVNSQSGTTDLKSQCGIDSFVLEAQSDRCANITTISDFRSAISPSSLATINTTCQVSLESAASCSSCTAAVVSSITYNATISACLDFSHIYAAAIANRDGPSNPSTVRCLFYQFQENDQNNKRKLILILSIGAAGLFLLLTCAAALVVYLCSSKKVDDQLLRNATLESSMHTNASLICFTMDEIKAATKNFHRSNIIGAGGFGNVYKGVLADDTVIAVKRFKNCSPSGDAEFVHEVEMISSVRHKNLVPIIGWCTGSNAAEGHQRIIVYEFMSNGSLYDHIFGTGKEDLDWPTRQKIATGTARGLAYLHNGAQPAIIHRDIKGGNILLDGDFNARVADFGLARFSPEGMTHMTTGVAGTKGYVAPEYVMYQQLTDKNDVYSFGIVLLELLTGRSALVPSSSSDTPPLPLGDWAWAVVKRGEMSDVLHQQMKNPGTREIMERFILVGLLCAHPQVAYRPSMSQVVKMLENDVPLPDVPERPIPLMLDIAAIDELTSVSSQETASTTSYRFSSYEVPR